MRPSPVEYRTLRTIRGPLVVVEGIEGVGWDEEAFVRVDGGGTLHGVVQDISGDHAVVQVYEGTSGIGEGNARVGFLGRPATIPVGEAWLGRVTNGRGEPIDGGPPIVGD